jgi:uncharacterized protein (DUF952 family)
MADKNTAEFLIAYTNKRYERKEQLIWLTIGKEDIDRRLGYETNDEQWDSIFETLNLKFATELEILIDETLEEITGV